MKKYFYLFFIVLTGLFLSACEDSTTDPVDGDTGSIYIQSNPAGAAISVDGVSSGKVTPDSVLNLTTGSHTIKLQLANYKDTTFTLTVNKGLQTSKSVTLTSNISFTTFTDTVWETSGTTAAQPSGIDLSSGTAVSTGNAAHDIFYTSTGFVIRTSTSRSTVFHIGTGTEINDGVDSPLARNVGEEGWADRVGDREPNYFFLFDQDLHYTKMKIINHGGGSGPGDPAWVIVTWYYNTVANDQRF